MLSFVKERCWILLVGAPREGHIQNSELGVNSFQSAYQINYSAVRGKNG